MQVGLFIPCLTDTFFPRVGAAAVAVLRHFDCTVRVPLEQTCCGQPAFNNGLRRPPARLVDRLARIFEPDEYVVSPSASCVAMVTRHGPELFGEGTRRRERARALAEKTFELVTFLEEVLHVDLAELAPKEPPPRATYHYPCHCRGLVSCGTAAQRADRLLGGAHVPLPRADQCCGFGGTFATDHHLISNTMLADKLDLIGETGAELLLCDEAGCRLNIAGGLHRRGAAVRVVHTAELIAESLGLRLPEA